MFFTRHERSVSPSGGSILITSAPKSASCKVSTLHATSRDRSTTRTPFRGPRASGVKVFLTGFIIVFRTASLLRMIGAGQSSALAHDHDCAARGHEKTRHWSGALPAKNSKHALSFERPLS